MSTISRRALLAGAAGSVALAAGGCGARDGHEGGAASPVPGVEVRDGTLRSRHWPGRRIGWRLTTQGGDASRRPLVVVLHGKGASAASAFDPLRLQAHVRATGLTLASVDGGDFYWHRRRSGVDPGAMVVDDLLPLLRKETGWTGKVAFLGWSMGGYGSLLLASRLGPDRVFAVVAESAALWTSPGASAPGAFDGREDFLAHDVFAPERLAVLRRIPVRLDCGRSDPFVAANRAFARRLPTAHLTIDDGGHTNGYWRDHAAAQLQWVSQQPH
jgi:enterochelin esterase-like enzyme